MEVLTNDSIRFFSNGIVHRTLYHNGITGRALMITTQADYAIVEIHDWNNPAQRSEIVKMSYADSKTPNNPYGCATFGGGWRELSGEGADRVIIREIISAINYAVSAEARSKMDAYSGEITPELCGLTARITELSRPVWANNPDEPIPTPIPSRNQ